MREGGTPWNFSDPWNHTVHNHTGNVNVFLYPQKNYLLEIERCLWVYVTPLLLFPGTLGNILCIITMQTSRFQKTATSFLLSALACVDIVSLYVGGMYMWLYHLAGLDIRTTSNVSCKIVMFLTYLSVHLSAWTLVLVTVERVVSVSFPYKAAALCSKRRMIIVWVIMALAMAAINSPQLKFELLHLLQQNSIEMTECTLPYTLHATLRPYIYWVDLLMSCILPTLLIFTGNALLAYKLSAMTRKKRSMQTASQSPSATARRASSVTVMLMVVSITFILTTLPINIYLEYQMKWFPDPHDKPYRLITFASVSLLYYLNNAINFVLYFISGPPFRKAVGELLQCKRVSSRSPCQNRSKRRCRNNNQQSISLQCQGETAVTQSAV